MLDDVGRSLSVAAEPVIEIRHKKSGKKIAWHIGNRHTPCEIRQDCLVIRCDHVLEDLLMRLGGDIGKNQGAPSILKAVPMVLVARMVMRIDHGRINRHHSSNTGSGSNCFHQLFPIGAFSYSHGIEAAITSGDVVDAATTYNWIRTILHGGSGRNDADF